MLNMFYSTSKFRGVAGPCLRFTNTNVFLKSFSHLLGTEIPVLLNDTFKSHLLLKYSPSD